jgi:hypothetical protein
MKNDDTEFESLLQALAAEKLTPTGAHRTPDELAAYHFHQLSADQEEDLQDHLVTCRACTLLLLDLAELCATEPKETRVPASSETTTASRTPRQPSAAPAPRTFFQRLREQFFGFRLLPASAVLLFVCSVALGAWALSLRRERQTLVAQLTQQQTEQAAVRAQEIAAAQQQRDEAHTRAEQLAAELEKTKRAREELAKPQPNIPIVTPLPGDTRSHTPQAIELSDQATRFTLVIPATAPATKYSDYALEILNQSGTTIVNEKGLAFQPDSGFTILLPSRLFPAGEYRVKVFGLGRGAKVSVAETVVRLRYKP